MNLARLLTAAAAGTAPISLDQAATLYAAAADDRHRMSLYAAPAASTMPVTFDAFDETPVATVHGVLRYLIDGDDITRLCSSPTCYGESIGTGVLTRVCRDHLDVLVPGLLPNAADDIRPGDRESAAAESRRMRLRAWNDEIAETQRVAAGDRRVMESLTAEAVTAR